MACQIPFADLVVKFSSAYQQIKFQRDFVLHTSRPSDQQHLCEMTESLNLEMCYLVFTEKAFSGAAPVAICAIVLLHWIFLIVVCLIL